MPPLSVFKAAARFERLHGDRADYQAPPLETGPKAELMICGRCGTATLVSEVLPLALCACGEPLNIQP